VLNFKRNLILKNSLNYIFFKKLKYLHKKNLFLNFFFFNNFISLYKNNNIKIYLNSFFYNNLNLYYIYNVSFFKKQFLFNLNFLKTFFKNKNLKFLFLKKTIKNNFFINNCLFLNVSEKIINLNSNQEFLENFILFNPTFINYTFNYIYFINFNFLVFNLMEFYKVFILLHLNKIL